MDPDAVYRRLKDALDDYGVAESTDDIIEAADEVMNAFGDLDTWMRQGGFPPRQWVI